MVVGAGSSRPCCGRIICVGGGGGVVGGHGCRKAAGRAGRREEDVGRNMIMEVEGCLDVEVVAREWGNSNTAIIERSRALTSRGVSGKNGCPAPVALT